MLKRRTTTHDDGLDDAAAVSAFKWSDTGDGCTHALGEPHFRDRQEAERGWQRVRRLMWAVTPRFSVPDSSMLFDGVTTEGLAFVRATWNHAGPYDLVGALTALATDRANLATFAQTEAAATIADYLALFRQDLDRVEQTARDLAAVPPFRTWITDLASPGLVKMMNARGGDMVAAAGAPFKFAPPDGPAFFAARGWTPVDVASLLKTARRLKRLPLMLRLISLLPESKTPPPGRPWSAVIQLERAAT
jgi:hypothetical protein